MTPSKAGENITVAILDLNTLRSTKPYVLDARRYILFQCAFLFGSPSMQAYRYTKIC